MGSSAKSANPVVPPQNAPHSPLRGYERTAWKWMRYSGILVIPLVFIHVLLQDILVGVHDITIDYVVQRWSNLGWRLYDTFLLIFAFTHGMNGLRQVLMDYIHTDTVRLLVTRLLLVFWLVISLIGAIALIGGVSRA
jgi:succinate dehydrogenase / fumarate reductase membrane anchor subunit